MVYIYKKSTGKWYHWRNFVSAFVCGGIVVGIMYQCAGCLSVLAEQLLYFRNADP